MKTIDIVFTEDKANKSDNNWKYRTGAYERWSQDNITTKGAAFASG